MKKIDELKAEAKELGVTFSANIGEAKLQDKIDAVKSEVEEPEEDGTPEWIKQAAEKTDAEEAVEESKGWGKVQRRKLAAQREAEAKKTKIITIIDNDQRENNQTTSAVVTCSNAHFDLGTMVLPLGVDVEVMQGHIDVLKGVKIPQHTKGANGNGVTNMRPRYSISYSEKKPS